MTAPAKKRSGATESADRRQAYLLVAPSVVILVGVALYPIIAAIWLSMHRMILVFHEQKFIGLSNYGFLLHDARF